MYCRGTTRTKGVGWSLAIVGWAVSLALAQNGTTPPIKPHAGMMRFPDVSATHIVFVYSNDIWLVRREGGMAEPLASPPGQEAFPRFSPDGKTIAFVGNYDGNRDLYTIPVGGGIPFRVTYHPAGEALCDWTPDGKLLFYTNGYDDLNRRVNLLTAAATGGAPSKLPVPYGANGAISADGRWLAYTPHTVDFRTWKRYRGGMATDVWLFDLQNKTSKQITNWEGSDSLPMWHKQMVYYLSDDGPSHRQNIWGYDTASGQRSQVTTFKDDDVKFPSIGPGDKGQGEIVFSCGAELYLLDLGSKQSRVVQVTVPGDRPRLRPQPIDVKDDIENWALSATGKRVVVESRGDIWTLPAEKGTARNLTRTSGVAERDPAWSPDGRWIAYLSDETGEYELYVKESDGDGETKQLTKGGDAFRYSPTWSPDSKHIAFSDKGGRIFLHTIESGETKHIDTEPWAGQTRLSWSSDSSWITYAKGGDNFQSSVWIYGLADGKAQQVTSGMFNDSWPTFDRKGDFLLLASNREFSAPIYEDVGTSFVYANSDRLMLIPLRKDVKSPFLSKSDEESWEGRKGDEDKDKEKDEDEEEAEDDATSQPTTTQAATAPASSQASTAPATSQASEEKGKDSKDKKKKKPPKPVKIDFEDFEARAILVPVERGGFTNLAFNEKGHFLYTRQPGRGVDDEPAIHLFDPKNEKQEEKTVAKGVGQFVPSADGEKLLISRRENLYVVDAAADQKLEKAVPRGGMIATIDPRPEWRQLFTDAWRIERDFFYDPGMHGLDWKAVREHYEKMLDDCASREDLSYVISEMISELNVGHAYYSGGATEDQPSLSVGMLGCDFEIHEGALRVARIIQGAPWDIDGRGPLSQPGVDVKVGDYIHAVNFVPVDTSKDPLAAFQGLADRVVVLTVSDKPKADDTAREVTVKLLSSDRDLRFRAFVEAKRKYVEEKSGGKVGYVYVPNTGVDGQNELFRQFYGQRRKDALIVDDRWNGGGQIPTRFVELLNRPIANYWARRDGNDWTWPPDAHFGPKCMLINGLAGSGGDYFPWWFRQAGVGKLIGMRTWGGLVGISGNPGLIDGGRVTAPTFAFYEKDGTWGIEGHGVDPDIEVIDDPAKMVDGADPQLDKAVELMLAEVQKNPYVPPKRPAYPDRRGMGIKDTDR